MSSNTNAKLGFCISSYIKNKESYDDLVQYLNNPSNDMGCMRHLPGRNRVYERYEFTSLVNRRRIPKVVLVIEDEKTCDVVDTVDCRLVDISLRGFRVVTPFFKTESDIKSFTMTFIFVFPSGARSVLSADLKSLVWTYMVKEDVDEDIEIII